MTYISWLFCDIYWVFPIIVYMITIKLKLQSNNSGARLQVKKLDNITFITQR
jgi:hypothetical protein